MTPRKIAEYYISPLDPNKFPDKKGISPNEIEEHTQRLSEAIGKYCKEFVESGVMGAKINDLLEKYTHKESELKDEQAHLVKMNGKSLSGESMIFYGARMKENVSELIVVRQIIKDIRQIIS